MDKEEAAKMKALEKFMKAVAQLVGCVPSYSDPDPEGGNAHIVKQLRHLSQQTRKEIIMDDAKIEMPKYRSHKEVWALKIVGVREDSDQAAKEGRETDGSSTLVFEDGRYASLKVSREYVRKHDPQPGGYYVVYEDGYESWSPAQAFESGYTKISG